MSADNFIGSDQGLTEMTKSNVIVTGPGYYDIKLDKIQTDVVALDAKLASLIALMQANAWDRVFLAPPTPKAIEPKVNKEDEDRVREWFSSRYTYTNRPKSGYTLNRLLILYKNLCARLGEQAVPDKFFRECVTELTIAVGGELVGEKLVGIQRRKSCDHKGVWMDPVQPDYYQVKLYLIVNGRPRTHTVGRFVSYTKACAIADAALSLKKSLGKDHTAFFELWSEMNDLKRLDPDLHNLTIVD